MILQSLVKYFQALEAAGKLEGPAWSVAKVSDRILLDKNGKLLGIISAKNSVQSGKKVKEVPALLSVPKQNSNRTSGVAANFLCDNSSYLFGVDEKWKTKAKSIAEDDPGREKKIVAIKQKGLQRALECFTASKKLHDNLLSKINSPCAQAVVNFFDHWDPQRASENEVLKENWKEVMEAPNFIFQVDGVDVQKDNAIREAWAESCSQSQEKKKKGECLVTGKYNQPIARIHPLIKGVAGAQSSGASLVSFNAPAFESYGNEEGQGYNAPVSEYAAFAYAAALNYLISQHHSLLVGDTTVVYWSEHGENMYQNLFGSLLGGETQGLSEKELEDILQKILQGETFDKEKIHISPDEPFYILGLAPNAARLSVRFFYTNRFGTVVQHLEEHQERMKIVKPSWETKKNIPMWALLKSTVSPKAKGSVSSPLLAGSLLRAVLSGGKYPEALYRNILLRVFADSDKDKITYIKAAFIKAYLLKNFKDKWDGVITMNINPNCREKAYVLGRLFAVLEDVQQSANPGINTTIKDRYFNSACATPAVVFPTLLKLANAHLAKLNKGQQIALEKKIGNLLSMISMPDQGAPIPGRLTLEEQGVFVLGYYQETQDRFTKKEDK